MAYTNIDDPSAYFQALTYTGNGTTTNNVTNTGNSNLQPDWVWIKQRSATQDHVVTDSSRDGEVASGTNLVLTPNTNEAEASSTGFGINYATNGINFDAAWAKVNASGQTYVAWQWKANGGTTTSVSASGTGSGCINACTHQANTTAGFSIITYTGRDDQLNNAQESKLTHGLGVAPTATIMKRTDSTGDWFVMGAFGGVNSYPYSNNQYLKLNGTESINGNYFVGDTAPDATHIFLGNAYVNIASATYVCYAFAEKQGYSKFGRYVGNGNANGPFVYTGFKPAFVMIKPNVAGRNWQIIDNTRDPHNVMDRWLQPNLTASEFDGSTASVYMDFLSNGFKLRTDNVSWNQTSQSIIYMAFAENPFVTSTGIPTTAR